MQPSAKAVALIEGFEIGNATSYISRPNWPGGASGLTIGIGYDLGYASAAQIANDWSMLPVGYLTRLQSYAGRTGKSAAALVSASADIVVPLDVARHVFEVIDIPRTSAEVLTAFPGSDALSGDAYGGLVSLVFNRGDDLVDQPPGSGNRLEMRQIRDAVMSHQFQLIPDLVRAMKRLWVVNPQDDPSRWVAKAGLGGLLVRRDAEADLIASGLTPPAPDLAQVA